MPPQGFVLGPILSAYALNLCSKLFNVLDFCTIYMLMIHISISQYCFAIKLSDIELCVPEIKVWTKCNMLKLKDDKTEFIVYVTLLLLLYEKHCLNSQHPFEGRMQDLL